MFDCKLPAKKRKHNNNTGSVLLPWSAGEYQLTTHAFRVVDSLQKTKQTPKTNSFLYAIKHIYILSQTMVYWRCAKEEVTQGLKNNFSIHAYLHMNMYVALLCISDFGQWFGKSRKIKEIIWKSMKIKEIKEIIWFPWFSLIFLDFQHSLRDPTLHILHVNAPLESHWVCIAHTVSVTEHTCLVWDTVKLRY